VTLDPHDPHKPPAAVSYRPALPEDAAACVILRGQTRENAVSVARLQALGITADSWAADVRSGALPGWVCLANDRLVGYCFGDRATGEVVVLALLSAFEQRGIGQHLLDQVVALLQHAGHRRLFLGCSADPTSRSYGFYRHLGWQSTGEVDRLGDEVLALVLPAAAD
jgi:ribosomal protein S18 acetylase RimI-like enzyme